MPREFDVPQDIIEKVLSKELTPSAYSSYMSAIHSKHVIAINAAYLIGNWIDMIFFGDNRWFLENRVRLAEFPGLKVTCHTRPNKCTEDGIKYLPRDRQHGKGISPHSNMVCWNQNSGAAAVSIAANAGVKRIILLGFDMKLGENNKQHWHGLYGTANITDEKRKKGLPFHRHLRGFSFIAKDAKDRGIEILNACLDSVIEDFKKVTVKELL